MKQVLSHPAIKGSATQTVFIERRESIQGESVGVWRIFVSSVIDSLLEVTTNTRVKAKENMRPLSKVEESPEVVSDPEEEVQEDEDEEDEVEEEEEEEDKRDYDDDEGSVGSDEDEECENPWKKLRSWMLWIPFFRNK